MKEETSIALVGIGGYAELYVRELLKEKTERRLAAVIDPFAGRAKTFPEITAAKIPIFNDLEEMYKSVKSDLIVISSPIHLHRPQTECALAHGSDVLCEKPAAGSLEDALSMQEAERRSGRFLAIGYQWSFSKAIIDLKEDIASGRLGRPLRFRTLALWPRPQSYYKRNSWAGAVRTSDGAFVNDSPLNNACAHYLHNCFYILDAQPEDIQAETFRANTIENYDTVAFRCKAAGAEILFYSSHATRLQLGPVCSYEFENATVSYDSASHQFSARFKDGSLKSYGDPETDNFQKLNECIKCAGDGGKPVCRIGDALAQTRCMDEVSRIAVHQAGKIETLENSGDPLTTIKGIPETMTLAFAQGVLP